MSQENPSVDVFDEVIKELKRGDLTPEDEVYWASHILETSLFIVKHEEDSGRQPDERDLQRIKLLIKLVPGIVEIVAEGDPEKQQELSDYLQSKNPFLLDKE